MRTLELQDFIKTKESSKKHTEEELSFFIENLNQFSQEQVSNWLRAVKKNGLDDEETTVLTMVMAQSGEMLSWQGLEPTIDKHSTGGIGDKISLLFVPLVSSYGPAYASIRINIPKLSGRSLGITGGTIDKLESIPGFKTNLSIDQIKEQIKKISIAICSAGSDLAPADKKLYSIRDVTDTIDSIPLIASSIMSKKIAGGARSIILDVKFGSGAFMKKFDDAKLLATKMVTIGRKLNRNIKAIISNMDQPLGYAVGNALEIKEVLDILSGKEVSDLTEIVISLAKEAIEIICPDKNDKNLEEHLKELLFNGAALKKFEEMIIAQGGDLKAPLQKAKCIEILKCDLDGFIHSIDAFSIGEVVHGLGAGRKAVSDKVDHSVGVLFYKKHGDKVDKGMPLLEIHAKNKEDAETAKEKLAQAVQIGQNKPSKLKLVEGVIS